MTPAELALLLVALLRGHEGGLTTAELLDAVKAVRDPVVLWTELVRLEGEGKVQRVAGHGSTLWAQRAA